jgi:hypothetical protein
MHAIPGIPIPNPLTVPRKNRQDDLRASSQLSYEPRDRVLGWLQVTMHSLLP